MWSFSSSAVHHDAPPGIPYFSVVERHPERSGRKPNILVTVCWELQEIEKNMEREGSASLVPLLVRHWPCYRSIFSFPMTVSLKATVIWDMIQVLKMFIKVSFKILSYITLINYCAVSSVKWLRNLMEQE